MSTSHALIGNFIWYNEEGVLTKSLSIYDVKTVGNVAAYTLTNEEVIFFTILGPSKNWVRISPDAPIVQEFKTKLLLDGIAL